MNARRPVRPSGRPAVRSPTSGPDKAVPLVLRPAAGRVLCVAPIDGVDAGLIFVGFSRGCRRQTSKLKRWSNAGEI